MSKRAPTDHPVHDLIAERWSPFVFAERPVAVEDVRSIVEAARWAPSSFNEQPWRYIVGRKGDEVWQGIFDGLTPPNQAWAEKAGVLLVSVASMRYALNDKPNAHAWHDVGLATGNMLAEITARGLLAHQMGGFYADKIRARFAVPEGHEPCAAMAIGYRGDPATAAPELVKRERGERSRRPLAAFVVGDRWGQPASFLGD